MSDYKQITDRLRQRLQQPLPGLTAQEKMMGRVVTMPLKVPDNARLSAVLCLLFPVNGALNVLLMKRREDKTAHSGQVSFPGGSMDKEDDDLKATALREAWEEVGIHSSDFEVLGALTPLYIPVSNFHVFPFVAFAEKRLDYNLSQNEVSFTIEVPLTSLFHHERKTITDVISPAIPGVIRQVRAYKLEDGTIIWGATAMMLSELEAVFMEVAG